jgi:hypothetical protein
MNLRNTFGSSTLRGAAAAVAMTAASFLPFNDVSAADAPKEAPKKVAQAANDVASRITVPVINRMNATPIGSEAEAVNLTEHGVVVRVHMDHARQGLSMAVYNDALRVAEELRIQKYDKLAILVVRGNPNNVFIYNKKNSELADKTTLTNVEPGIEAQAIIRDSIKELYHSRYGNPNIAIASIGPIVSPSAR